MANWPAEAQATLLNNWCLPPLPSVQNAKQNLQNPVSISGPSMIFARDTKFEPNFIAPYFQSYLAAFPVFGHQPVEQPKNAALTKQITDMYSKFENNSPII